MGEAEIGWMAPGSGSSPSFVALPQQWALGSPANFPFSNSQIGFSTKSQLGVACWRLDPDRGPEICLGIGRSNCHEDGGGGRLHELQCPISVRIEDGARKVISCAWKNRHAGSSKLGKSEGRRSEIGVFRCGCRAAGVASVGPTEGKASPRIHAHLRPLTFDLQTKVGRSPGCPSVRRGRRGSGRENRPVDRRRSGCAPVVRQGGRCWGARDRKSVV